MSHLTISENTSTITLTLSPDDLADLRAVLAADDAPEKTADGPTPTPKPSQIPKPEPPAAPAAEPVFTSISGEDAPADLKVSPETLRLLHDAKRWAERLGLSNIQLAEIINDPEDEWADETGEKHVYLRDSHAVVVGIGDDTILSVIDRRTAMRRRPEWDSGIRRGHGGVGTRYPTSMGELESIIRNRGASITYVGSGHRRVDFAGRSTTLTTTPSDHRSIRNSITEIENALGLDLRRDSAR